MIMMMMIIIIIIIIIIINFTCIASISLTVLGALQYPEKCIRTTLTKKNKKLDTDLVINQEKAWCNKYAFKCFLKEFKESAFLKDAGRLFHNLGPAIENRRSP